ncbi:MinD superfamily P-loop ATPase [Keratinibaculum paraultunense]|uniref:MinD superfamily P-loop ATPase n=1 Tax=Keratinibaculum paraultunense TaxID=1278232 RepID=A0A4R3KV15_9FIRM|nr:ATP-binding protein [Keratinibaculum paraultunense]QQY79851.1 ATP-binding protein [Keratinibaculum paraultunense]TCS88734.1 MinD superfamily P-loop ATPase [Keratinibaculum paraultunense]
MNIAVLSGKGGTGKTTISTNLALLLKANYIDCDVEEPNGFIFLKPEYITKQYVEVEIPEIDEENCTLCGRCVEICKFNALAKAKDKIILFDKLCHSCGACILACPIDAIKFTKRTIGVIEQGKKGEILLKRGLLNIGEPISVPILKELLKDLPEEEINLLDSPPGTSCNVVNVLNYADIAILVTEPTAFGLHDLKMAVELVKRLNIPFGLIINKYDENNLYLKEYIEEEGIKIVGYLPYKKEIAEAYSKGKILIEEKEYKDAFKNIANNIKEVLL